MRLLSANRSGPILDHPPIIDRHSTSFPPEPPVINPPLVAGELPWWIEPPTAEEVAATVCQPPPPKALPEPCPTCSCPFWWESLGGQVHCCQCVEIPSRRMVREAWQVLWDPAEGRAYWAAWEPVYFQPFAHLEKVETHAAAKSAEGF